MKKKSGYYQIKPKRHRFEPPKKSLLYDILGTLFTALIFYLIYKLREKGI